MKYMLNYGGGIVLDVIGVHKYPEVDLIDYTINNDLKDNYNYLVVIERYFREPIVLAYLNEEARDRAYDKFVDDIMKQIDCISLAMGWKNNEQEE